MISVYDNATPYTKTFSSFDTNFSLADSPVVLDVNTGLSKNSVDGFIINNGTGRLTYEISEDGSTYDSSINLEPNTGHNLTDISIDSIRITWVADTSYEVVMW